MAIHLVGQTKLVGSFGQACPVLNSQLLKYPVSAEESRFTTRFLPLLASWLVASLVSSDQVYAVAIRGVGLLLRNRTSRFGFCGVAAR
jgi:hypothetical protein